MSEPVATMNAEALFTFIEADLRPYVEGFLKGHLSIAKDPFEVTELLGEGPGRFRVILAWDGEEIVGESGSRSGIVAHRIRAVVSHNRGLSVLKGENIAIKRGNDRSLMALTTLVRDRLRTLTLPAPATSRVLEYQGSDPVSVDADGKVAKLDAFETRWRVYAAMTKAVMR